MAAPEPIAIEKRPWLGCALGFLLHTCAVYYCAVHLSEWLVFHWYGWIMPLLSLSSRTPATDWYLLHFELITIIPALVAGYLNFARFLPSTIRGFVHESQRSMGTWVWTVPTLFLLYRMLTFHAPAHSVLFGSSMTALEYFFAIVKAMPTLQDLFASDPVRAWAQMSITAPFYAGVAYSVGVFASRHQVLETLIKFEKHDEESPTPDQAGV